MTRIQAESAFAMTANLKVLERLEINPCSSIVAVLTEVVASAWDARAWYGPIAAQWLNHIPGSTLGDSHANVAQLKAY